MGRSRLAVAAAWLVLLVPACVPRISSPGRTTAGRYAMGFQALDLVPGLVQRPADPVSKETFARGACG